LTVIAPEIRRSFDKTYFQKHQMRGS
jgi:hypothetical protein